MGLPAPRSEIRAEIVIWSGNVCLGRFPLTHVPGGVAISHVSSAPSTFPCDVVARLGHDDPLVADAIKQWAEDMQRRGCKPRSIKNFTDKARSLCASQDWRTVSDLALAGAIRWLAEQRASGRFAGTTHDQAVSALRCWGEFLEKVQIVTANPFQHLEACGETGGEGSRAALTEEARKIIAAARRWETTDRKVKSPLALWYTFLFLTGLRTAEASAVRWSDVILDGAEPGIVTDPAWTKNGKRMAVPLNSEIAGLLREQRRATKIRDDGRVFPRTPNRHTWHRVLSMTDVRSVDERLRSLTAHGCRKWLGTELDRLGASPGIVALALRHYQDLAQERYIDRLSSEAREYFERLPRLWPDAICVLDNQLGPSNPQDSGDSDACNPTGQPIDLIEPTDAVQVEHASQGSKCPFPIPESVLERVIETHARFLEIVASALRPSDDPGNPDPPT